MTETTTIRTYADYQKYNFFRTPEWRWERVLKILDRPDGSPPGRCTRRDDDVVRAARYFALKWRKGDPEIREKLLWDFPGLYYAYDFHQRLDDDPEAALYIQARLLARQTPDEIAAAMGVLPEAVTWYADLFFDVVPYLDKRDWVTKQILVPAMLRTAASAKAKAVTEEAGFKDSTVARPLMDGSLKLFAYFGGPHLVDFLITGMQAGRPLASPDDLTGWLDNVVSTTVKLRTAQAAKQFEINKYNVMELFTVHNQIMAIEKSEDNQDQTKTTQERHIKAMMDEIPWATGDDAGRLYAGTAVGRFDNMPAELRDDEVLLLASGQPAPSLAGDYPRALPAPRREKTADLAARTIELP